MSPQQKDIMDYVAQLKNLPKQHDYFIGFDSDGCVFDTMELKHKECFCPAVIKHMGCQPVSKAAREVWDFVNLYQQKRLDEFDAALPEKAHWN